jgi:serine/threonine protein phosphatase PrpC
MEEFTITYGAVTHVGQVRTGNEDSLLADNNVFMWPTAWVATTQVK